jgi:hypothetical protein
MMFVLAMGTVGFGQKSVIAVPAGTATFDNGACTAKFVRSASGIIQETGRTCNFGPFSNVRLQFRPLSGPANPSCDPVGLLVEPFVFVNNEASISRWFVAGQPYNVCVYQNAPSGTTSCTTQAVSSVTSMTAPVSFAVTPNTTYTITSDGTYFANDGIYADAKYSERNSSGFWTDLVQNYPEYGATLLDLQVSSDGSSFVSPGFGDYTSTHKYTTTYTTGAAQTQLFFRIYDVAPDNNTGDLSVSICTGS